MPTWGNQSKQNRTEATGGMYIGFGAFTYSGGQDIGVYTPTAYTNTTKDTSVWINQDKD